MSVVLKDCNVGKSCFKCTSITTSDVNSYQVETERAFIIALWDAICFGTRAENTPWLLNACQSGPPFLKINDYG